MLYHISILILFCITCYKYVNWLRNFLCISTFAENFFVRKRYWALSNILSNFKTNQLLFTHLINFLIILIIIATTLSTQEIKNNLSEKKSTHSLALRSPRTPAGLPLRKAVVECNSDPDLSPLKLYFCHFSIDKKCIIHFNNIFN